MTNVGYECCICHKRFTDWGNNPWPIVTDKDARCCNACNGTVVVPARIAKMFNDTTPKKLNDIVGRR